MTDKLLFEMRGHTALMTINNPSANTWDEDNLTALRDLIAEPSQVSQDLAGN